MKFSFSKAASTLSLAALGVAAATSAQAAISSINVEITKITAFKDAANITTGAAVLFDAENGIGGSSNVTVDLLNTSNAAGTSIPLRNLTADEAGVYRTVLIEVAPSTATTGFYSVDDEDNGAAVANVLTAETVVATGNTPIIIGDYSNAVGTGIENLLSGAVTTSGLMKPLSTAGGVVTLPTLDIQIPANSVAENGSNEAVFTQAPAIVTKSAASTSNDTNVRDLVLTIADSEMAVFDDATAEGEDTVKVGLFSSLGKGILGTADYTADLTFTRDTGTGAVDVSATDDASVEFADVANGTYTVFAWGDDNNNNMIDAKEVFVNGGTLAGNNAAFTTVTLADGDPVVADTDNTVKALDLAATTAEMVTPTVTINLEIDDTEADPKDDFAVALNGSTAVTGADGQAGTVDITLGNAVFNLPVLWEEIGGDNSFTNSETATPILTTGYAAVVSAIPGATYATATETLSVVLPVTTVTGVDTNGVVGSIPAFSAGATVNPGAEVIAADTTLGVAGAGAIANTDYDAAGVINATTAEVVLTEL